MFACFSRYHIPTITVLPETVLNELELRDMSIFTSLIYTVCSKLHMSYSLITPIVENQKLLSSTLYKSLFSAKHNKHNKLLKVNFGKKLQTFTLTFVK